VTRDDSSTPLASSTVADPSADRKAYKWTDGTLPKRKFPFTANETVGDRSLSEVRSRAVEVLARRGYPVVLDTPAEVPLQFGLHPSGISVQGIVVGEQRLRIDVPRRTMALRLTLLSAAVMIVGLAGIVRFLPSDLALASMIPMGAGFFGVMWFGPAYGAFDSEVAYVAFSSVVHTEAETEVPGTVQVSVGVAKVASANWASKNGNGREFKSVLPGPDELRELPPTILNEILG
jgi:hypothetical protein